MKYIAILCDHCSRVSKELISAPCPACGWRSPVCPACHADLSDKAGKPYAQHALKLHKEVCKAARN